MGQGFANQRLGINLSAGTGLAQTGTVVFSNANSVSFGMSLSASSLVITASITAQTAFQLSNSNGLSWGTNVSTVTGSFSTLAVANSNGISLGTAGSTLTASSGYTHVDFENYSAVRGLVNITNLTALSERPYFVPFVLPYYLTLHRMTFEASRATSGSNSFSVTAGIYTIVNSTSMALLGSVMNSFSASNSGSVSGIRQFGITNFPAAVTAMTPGVYVLGMHFHTLGGTASINYSIRGASTDSPLGYISAGQDQNFTATNQVSSIGAQFMGRYSTTTNALPANVVDADLFQGMSGSQADVPMWFRLGRTA